MPDSDHPSPAPHPSRDPAPRLSRDELRRYSRHLALPDVGPEGQRRLKASSVLLVGAGGLGSPLALYLAAAGVGRIGIVDFDRVDETNLQRQVLHGGADVGRDKVESARARLADLNPHVRVDAIRARLEAANAFEILGPYDVVADGADNFATRYLVNDACALLGKPNVQGSVFRFEGQASVFDARRGPCYRCLYPDPPPPGLVPSCAEGGVLGVLPGVIGTIQAIETLKLLLGVGEPLVGRLLVFDALEMRFRELALRKDPDCPLCGERPTIGSLIDYDAWCGEPAPQAAAAPASAEGAASSGGAPGPRDELPGDLTVKELRDRLARGEELVLVDVREPFEWEIARLPGATLAPLGTLASRLGSFDRERTVVLYCHTGRRSLEARSLLVRAGFPRVQNLRGGIDAWSREVDPSVPRY
jgi:adenylyltransferase/sulfurtransferase